MTNYDDEDRYYHQRDKRALMWVIGGAVVLVLAAFLAMFILGNRQAEQPARITPVPSASQTMTVTETPATVTETPPLTVTETKTSPTTVVVTRTEPVTTTVTTTVTAVPVP